MSARRDLESSLEDPGFTPSARDLEGLVALLERGRDPARLVRALGRLGERASSAVEARARLPSSRRVPLLRALRKLAPERALSVGMALAADAAAEVRREAARALGAGDASVRATLRERLALETDPSALRAVVEALGFVGDQTDAGLVRARAASVDLGHFAQRAVLRLERAAPEARDRETLPADDLGREVSVALRTRAGLAEVLREELDARLHLRGALALPDAVVVSCRRLSDLTSARTWLEARVLLEEASPSRRALEERVASLLEAELPGLRFRHRLELAGGKRRADLHRLAAHLAGIGHPNDPRQAPWTFEIDDRSRDGRLRLSVVPRLGAERFAYRVRDVPAASHPTVAAALARLGGVRPDDVVWDPFVGSGMELRERDVLGPARLLVGSDTSDAALAVARENLAGATAPVQLLPHDARSPLPLAERPTLVLTNPPLGRRVGGGEGHKQLVLQALDNMARALDAGGRLVWLSPLPRETREAARHCALELREHREVDLDGIRVELQIFDKPRLRGWSPGPGGARRAGAPPDTSSAADPGAL